jgi:CBS domain-containing protein
MAKPARAGRRDGAALLDTGALRSDRSGASSARLTASWQTTVYTRAVSETTEAAVARRVPSLADERLRVLSRRQPVTVPPGTSLAECVRAIQRTGTGDSVFVCDASGRLTGVLTERDIFARIVGGSMDLQQPVETLMTTEPRTLDLDDTIRDAIVLMQTGRYRNVPMVDTDGALVGVVRQSDIIKYLAESFPEELLNLPPRPHQRMKEPEGA